MQTLTITQDEYNELAPWLDDTDDDEQLEDEPTEDDYFITDNDRPGSRTRYLISQYGKIIGGALDWENVESFIRIHMQREQFYPNAWHARERGIFDLVVIDLNRPDES